MMTVWPRREVLVAMGSAAIAMAAGRARAELKPVAGMQQEPWFKQTTFDLRKDLQAASDADKVLALIWEQQGCEYCEQMHEVALKQPELIALGKKRFHVLQMDLWGERQFIDFDGEKVSEAKLARSLAVRGTPTTVFYDETGDQVFRMPGFASPEIFYLVYEYVAEEGYQDVTLQNWAKLKYGAK
jgi:thioredoxin-related protein